jgi:hypothetical protein
MEDTGEEYYLEMRYQEISWSQERWRRYKKESLHYNLN